MQNSSRYRQFADRPWLYVLLGGCAAGLVWYATAWGPWAYSDGVGYLVSARNLLDGVGLGLVKPSGAFEPLVSHPPLYPLLLAGFGSLGIDLSLAASLIDGLAFALLVAVSGWAVARLYPESWAGPATSLLILINPHILLLFLSAMAEPLFLLAGFVGLLVLALHLSEEKSGPPVLAGILISSSILARYPGLAFWIAGATAMLLLGDRFRRRNRDLLVFSSISVGPTALFWLWGTYVVTSTSPRASASELELLQSARSFLSSLTQIIWNWKPIPPLSVLDPIFPEAAAEWIPRVIAFSLLLGLAIWATTVISSWRGRAGQPLSSSPLLGIMALFAISYLAFFFIGFSFTYPTPDVNQRTMSPLLVAGVIVFSSLLFREAGPEEGRRWGQPAALLALVSILAGYSFMTYDLATGFHRTGAGYTGRAWQSLQLESTVSRLGSDRPLISNHPAAVLLYTGRYPYDLTVYFQPGQGVGDECPEDLYDFFHARHARLILVGLSGDPSQPSLVLDTVGQELAMACDLTLTRGSRQIHVYAPREER